MSERKIEAATSETRQREQLERDVAEKLVLDDERAFIEQWNGHLAHGRNPLASPSIRAALATGHRYLFAFCPACRTERDIDLGAIDAHPETAVASLIPRLSCGRCRPHAPFAKLRRLSPFSTAGEARIERERVMREEYLCDHPEAASDGDG
jgi:hypothetical protein